MHQLEKKDMMGFLYFERDITDTNDSNNTENKRSMLIYPFSIQNYKMTIICLEKESDELESIKSNDWVFGIDEDNFDVAFKNNGVSKCTHFCRYVEKYILSIPIIVKSRCNGSYVELKEFDSLQFTGGAINYIYPPQKAYSYDIGSNLIKFASSEKYCRSFDIMLKEERINVVISIDTGNAQLHDLHSNNLGSVNSYIRFNFNNPQQIESLLYYQDLVYDFVSFCVLQTNIGIETQILKKDIVTNNISPSAFCWFNYGSNNVVNKDLMSVLRLESLSDDELVLLFQLFGNIDKIPYLGMLPANTNEVRFIRTNDICMLCTALEREYNKHGFCKKSSKKRIGFLYERYEEYMRTICEKSIEITKKSDGIISKEKKVLNTIYNVGRICI